MSQATTTTDHDEIRRWAEERGGRPSVVRTGRGRGGILRFDFGEDDEKLEETSWEEFFRVFEDSRLALLHQDTLEGGETSRFFKFVARGASSGAGRPRKAPSKRGTTLQRAPGKAAAKRSATKGASKRASSAASKGSARPKRASKAGSTARGGAKASARGASKAGTKDTARKSGTAAKKSGTASRTSRSAASSAGLKGATKRTRSGGRASKKPSR